MEMITLLFFAIGSFFGMENNQIAAMKTTVTIHPIEKTITIQQEDIIALLINKGDSSSMMEKLDVFNKQVTPWSDALKEYPKTALTFSEGENKTLNALIQLTYTNTLDLKAYGFSTSPNGKHSLINIPDWNIQTKDGTLEGTYWNFEPDAPFTFTIESLKKIPEAYKDKLVSLYPYWENNNE